jgi:HD superfamily phosphohydrolase YqeK
VARHIPPQKLLKEAERLRLPVNDIERKSPIILHGPVGASWLHQEGVLENNAVLEGVYWHTIAHPDLSLLGQVVLLADKLDPSKRHKFPFQPQVRLAAFHSLSDGLLAFLDGILRQQLERGELIHPTSSETRNRLITAASC